MAVLLGITMSAGEFRNNTATPTFLITPDRRRVMTAKVLAGGILGVVLAAVSAVLTVAIATPWLQSRNVDVNLLSADVITPDRGRTALPGARCDLRHRHRRPDPQSDHRHHGARRVVVDHRSVPHRLRARDRPLASDRRRQRARRNMDSEGGLLPFWAAALVLAGYCASAAAAGTHLISRKDMT